jgi:hypothetical protein
MSEHEEYRSLFLERDELIATLVVPTLSVPPLLGNTNVIADNVLPKEQDLSKDEGNKKII